VEPDEVVVRYTQTTLISGDPFEDNRTTATHTIRKQDDDWKFYDTEIKDVAYLAESEDVEDDFSSDDPASGRNNNEEERNTVLADEAQKVYQTHCAACHGGGLSGGAGPDLKNVNENYSQEELEDIIRNGMGSMPPIGDHLSQEEIDTLTEWLINKDLNI